jgi:hypothetical protein
LRIKKIYVYIIKIMKFFGMDQATFNSLVLLLLLVILGVVSFSHYYYIKAGNGLSMGAGASIGILTKE